MLILLLLAKKKEVQIWLEVSLLDAAPLRMRGRSLTKRIYKGSEQKQAQKKTGGWTDAGSRKKECPGLGGVLRRRLL